MYLIVHPTSLHLVKPTFPLFENRLERPKLNLLTIKQLPHIDWAIDFQILPLPTLNHKYHSSTQSNKQFFQRFQIIGPTQTPPPRFSVELSFCKPKKKKKLKLTACLSINVWLVNILCMEYSLYYFFVNKPLIL